MTLKYDIKDIISAAEESVRNNVKNYFKDLEMGTQDPKNFIKLHEIENNLNILNQTNKKDFCDFTSLFLSNIDERSLIELKKRT